MQRHAPVLLKESLAVLDPREGESMLDATVGLGGHARTIADRLGSRGSLTAIDADQENLSAARTVLSGSDADVTFIHANFRELPDCLPRDHRSFDVILADLGLSSPHIDEPSRGFSFRHECPLDLRFDRSRGMTGAMLLASLDKRRLTAVFAEYGELRSVHRFVDAIIARRGSAPVRSTGDLKAVADSVYGFRAPSLLPQVFQALRIAVNDEVAALQRLLNVAPTLLKSGGRLAILSYHSLEDRLVKQHFRSLTQPLSDAVTGAALSAPGFKLLTQRAIGPSAVEVARNPRSRSARLRALLRLPVYTSSRS